jgi:hypothetical protein
MPSTMKSTVRTTIHPDGKVEVETETSVSKDAGGATPYPSPSLAMWMIATGTFITETRKHQWAFHSHFHS